MQFWLGMETVAVGFEPANAPVLWILVRLESVVLLKADTSFAFASLAEASLAAKAASAVNTVKQTETARKPYETLTDVT